MHTRIIFLAMDRKEARIDAAPGIPDIEIRYLPLCPPRATIVLIHCEGNVAKLGTPVYSWSALCFDNNQLQ